MKAISASIIVLAAVMLILGGSIIQYDSDTRIFIQVTGCIVGLAGLVGWFMVLKEK